MRRCVEGALEIMTLGGAHISSQETVTGTLEKGKFADLIVISDSPLDINPDNFKDLKVLLTMVGGEIVYNGFAVDEPSSTTNSSSESENISSADFPFVVLLPVAISLIFIKRKIR